MPIEKIIVLEDDLVVRKSLEQQLRYRRYDVASASTIGAAQELLAKDNFDLMIVDVKLPDGEGTDLLKQLQSRPVKPLIVMVSPTFTVLREHLARERNLLVFGERLAAEHDDCVLVHRGVDRADSGRIDRFRDVDAACLGGEKRVQGFKLQAHECLLRGGTRIDDIMRRWTR